MAHNGLELGEDGGVEVDWGGGVQGLDLGGDDFAVGDVFAGGEADGGDGVGGVAGIGGDAEVLLEFGRGGMRWGLVGETGTYWPSRRGLMSGYSVCWR